MRRLRRSLIPHAADAGDGSHDLAHIHRVFRNAMRIHAGEGGDGTVLAASVLLHDCVAVEKNCCCARRPRGLRRKRHPAF